MDTHETTNGSEVECASACYEKEDLIEVECLRQGFAGAILMANKTRDLVAYTSFAAYFKGADKLCMKMGGESLDCPRWITEEDLINHANNSV